MSSAMMWECPLSKAEKNVGRLCGGIPPQLCRVNVDNYVPAHASMNKKAAVDRQVPWIGAVLG